MAKKNRTGIISFAYKILRTLFIASIILIIIAIAYIALQGEQVRLYIKSKFNITFTKIDLDLASLTGNQCRFKVKLKIYNGLPIAVDLENLTYDVYFNNIQVGTGFQYDTKTRLPAFSSSSLDVWLKADSIKVKTALAKTIQKQTSAMVESVLDQLKGKKSSHSKNNGGILRISGKAQVHVFLGSLALPLDLSGAVERKLLSTN